MSCPRDRVTGVVLAGGKGSRLGGQDKGLISWHGRSLTQHIVDVLRTQFDSILISANRNIVEYEKLGYPVITDSVKDYAGPLAGMLSAMRQATTPYILTVPCDAPLFNKEVIQRFCHAGLDSSRPAYVAMTEDGMQPVYVLISVDLADDLQDYLSTGGRKASDWINQIRAEPLDCADLEKYFANINTAEDMEKLC